MKSANKQVILSKIESVYATDSVPAAVNAIMVQNVNCTPISANTVQRQRAYPTFGASPDAITAVFRKLSFDMPLQGAGAAGTAPLYGPLWRACGLSETISAGTSVVYAPVSSGQESNSTYFFDDGERRKLLGARGTLTWKFPANGLAITSEELTGLYSAMTDTAPPSVATQLASFVDEIEVNKANTQFTIDGYAAPLGNLEVAAGNVVTARDEPNAGDVTLTDRRATGTLLVAAESVATKDYEAIAKAHTLVVLQAIHGTVGGKIIQVDAPKVQLGIPSLQNRNGIRYMQFPLLFGRTSGDDEFTVTVK